MLRAQELYRRTLGLQLKYCDYSDFSHSAIMELRFLPQEIHIYANLYVGECKNSSLISKPAVLLTKAVAEADQPELGSPTAHNYCQQYLLPILSP